MSASVFDPAVIIAGLDAPGLDVRFSEELVTREVRYRVQLGASEEGGITEELLVQQPEVLLEQVYRAGELVIDQVLYKIGIEARLEKARREESGRIADHLNVLAKAQLSLAAHALVPGLDDMARHAAEALDDAAKELRANS